MCYCDAEGKGKPLHYYSQHTTMISSNNNSIKATNHEPGYSRFSRRSNEASQVVSKRKPHHKTDNTLKQKNKQNIINIGTWNVRTMLRAGNLEEVKT